MHIVFETNSEFAANVDSRLIAESHIGSHWCGIASNQVRPLVTIHSHPMADAMSEELVVGAVASVGYYGSCRGIYSLALCSGTRGFQRGGLSAMDDIEN